MTEAVADTTIVHLVRHGEVENPEGVLYGRLPDFHLSERGRLMAERIAEFFAAKKEAGANITHLATSPLERARETMQPIATVFPELEVCSLPLVIEAANDFEGMVFGRDNKALRNPRNWWKLRNPLTPSWGEPFVEIAARMRIGIQTAAEAAGPGGEAIVVSHQLPIWIARLDAEGRRLAHDPRKREAVLASVTAFHVKQGRAVRVAYEAPAADLIPAKDQKMNFSGGGK